MDSDSFYYSMTYDLTNSVQRQGDQEKSDVPLWKQVCGGTLIFTCTKPNLIFLL